MTPWLSSVARWLSSVARGCHQAIALIIAGVAVLLACPGTAAADAPNPPWQRQCPQRIALVVDLSDSMQPYLDSVQKSARDLVDALRDAPNEVAIITFGTDAELAVPATNVSLDDARSQVKEQIDELSADRGATNWDAALSSAHALRPDVMVLLTDGEPNTHGQPAVPTSFEPDLPHLTAAVRTADALKSDGIRVVGLGIGLRAENIGNLVAVTGPTLGDDYYDADASGLSTQLYEIASKACGVPVAAFPAPEPPEFPLVPVVVGAILAILVMVAGGMVLSRRRPDFNAGLATGQASRDGDRGIRGAPQDVNHSYPMRREREN